MNQSMDEHERITKLAKRRGFFFLANEAYGGTAGFYVYGLHGATIKKQLEGVWRERFIIQEGHMEIESPTVMPEAVFDASGHLEGFADLLIECPECGTPHRADHLVEEIADIADVEGLSPTEISTYITDYKIECPVCGMSLEGQSVDDFNLMFSTNIGPGSASPGYLRPETAQGIFVEFPQLKEYARGQLPFGVAQIGPAYRNEISPRHGLVRLREFTQAELEIFIDPDENAPPLEHVTDIELVLYPATNQMADNDDHIIVTVREAVDEDIVSNAWIAYYLGIAAQWYDRIGIDMSRFRFRQHLADERAHYASDTWDAEAEVAGNWIEITGIAYRGDYDLRKHDEYAESDFTLFKQYDEPQTVERPTVDPDLSYLGPKFGDTADDIVTALTQLAERDPDAFEGKEITVDVNGNSYTIPTEYTGFGIEEQTKSGEHIMPHIVEPSFGIDRLVYTVLAHNYCEDEIDGDPRSYLKLPVEVAPTFVGVFPLMTRDGLAKYAQDIATRLRNAGFTVAYDETGSIGRRYRRQDEIGTPFCVTIDYETLENNTVTLRDRDTAVQRRVSANDLPTILITLLSGEQQFHNVSLDAS